MSSCNICGKATHYLMNNRKVCLRCDELLFDIEIECEEISPPRQVPETPARRDVVLTQKKTTKL